MGAYTSKKIPEGKNQLPTNPIRIEYDVGSISFIPPALEKEVCTKPQTRTSPFSLFLDPTLSAEDISNSFTIQEDIKMQKEGRGYSHVVLSVNFPVEKSYAGEEHLKLIQHAISTAQTIRMNRRKEVYIELEVPRGLSGKGKKMLQNLFVSLGKWNHTYSKRKNLYPAKNREPVKKTNHCDHAL